MYTADDPALRLACFRPTAGSHRYPYRGACGAIQGTAGGVASEGSSQIRERVLAARERQRLRFSGEKMHSNAQMNTRLIRAHCALSTDAERLLERAMQQQGLSARAHDRILKVARTVADLAGAQNVEVGHLAEAIQYRTLDRTYWS